MFSLRSSGLINSAFISLGVQAAAYTMSTLGRDVPTDKFYDLSGAATNLALIANAVLISKNNPRVLTLGVLSGVWTLRLGSYLYERVTRIGGDARFDELKKDPRKWPIPWVLQAFWCWCLQAPLSMAASTGLAPRLGVRDCAGVLIFVGGLAIEWVADSQKDAFKRRNPSEPMTEGLFRYSVYANYFGECTLWCGAALLALPAARSPLDMVAALLAPSFDAFLLLCVSGIPLSDASSFKKYGGRPEYMDYRARTSLFIPFLPKKVAAEADLERVRRRRADVTTSKSA